MYYHISVMYCATNGGYGGGEAVSNHHPYHWRKVYLEQHKDKCKDISIITWKELSEKDVEEARKAGVI